MALRPMAAAVAAGQELELDKKILVADLGGGTFDLSVLEADLQHHSYRALDVDGDRHLGGDDFDTCLGNYFIQQIKADCGVDLSSMEASGLAPADYYSVLHRIQEEAEKAKTDLSDVEETNVLISELFQMGREAYSFEETLTREHMDAIFQPLYNKIFTRIHNFVSQSNKFASADIATIILAGGSCYIPYIQREMKNIFHHHQMTDSRRLGRRGSGALGRAGGQAEFELFVASGTFKHKDTSRFVSCFIKKNCLVTFGTANSFHGQ